MPDEAAQQGKPLGKIGGIKEGAEHVHAQTGKGFEDERQGAIMGAMA